MNPEVRTCTMLDTIKQRMAGYRFREWVESIRDLHAVEVIALRLDRIRAGNLGDYRKLGNGICEFRFFVGPGYRIYFARPSRRILLLLMGGAKGSQKADIEKAKAWYADYQARQL